MSHLSSAFGASEQSNDAADSTLAYTPLEPIGHAGINSAHATLYDYGESGNGDFNAEEGFSSKPPSHIFATICRPQTCGVFWKQALGSATVKVTISSLFLWGMFSNFGKIPNVSNWPDMPLLRWNDTIGSCAAFDISLGALLFGSIGMFFSSKMARKHLSEHPLPLGVSTPNCTVLLHKIASNRLYRCLCFGATMWALVGVPTMAIVWVSMWGAPIPPLDYIVFKSIWTAALVVVVHACAFWLEAHLAVALTPGT